jgi:non-specific serine/threonine protein kinase
MPHPLNDDLVYRLVGPRIWNRALDYLEGAMVNGLQYSERGPSQWTLTGRIQGHNTAVFHVTLTQNVTYLLGYCSCSIAVNCHHVAAVAMAAIDNPDTLRTRSLPAPAAPSAPSWQTLLSPWATLTRTIPRPAQNAPLVYRLDFAPVPGLPSRVQIRVQAGESTPWGFAPVPWSRLLDSAAAPSDKAVLPELMLLATSRSGAGSFHHDRPLAIAPHLVDSWLLALAQAPELLDNSGQALHIHPETPLEARLHYSKDEGGATLRPIWHAPDGPRAAVNPQFLGDPPAWIRLGDSLYPLATQIPTSATTPIRLTPDAVPAFERHYLPRLALAGTLDGPDAPTSPDAVPGRPQPQVLLEESKGKLVGRLGYVYAGTRIETGDLDEYVGPPSGPWETRDPDAEKALKAHLRRHVPKASGGRFSLAGEAALDFLADTLPVLVADGWEFLGEESLAEYRLRSTTPSARYRLSSGLDWFELDTSVELDGEAIPWHSLVNALQEGKRFVRLGSGGHAPLPSAWLEKHLRLLELLERDAHDPEATSLRIPRHQAPAVDALLSEADLVETDASWREFIDRLRGFGGIMPVPVPEPFRGELRPYQQQGLNFLSFLRDYGLHGILADDMGLGKTIQAAAFLTSLHASDLPDGEREPSLVVAPTSVLPNWASELARFAPSLRVLVLHGKQRDTAAISDADVVLTTYTTLRLDLSAHASRIYRCVILDEAQAIKNSASQTARAARALRARHRLCLTGTPIENDLMELWSQFAFLMPGMLGDERAFKDRYLARIAAGDDRAKAELRSRVSPFMLRRLKSEVAKELPPRTDVVIWCELAPAQRKAYEAVLSASRERVLAAVADKGLARSQITILDALLKLRQVCCHPRLLKTPQTMQLPSTKEEAFMELLGELREGGHRALVFSQFTSMLAILRERLDREGVPYEYLDGRTRDRGAKVERFNAGDAPLFLISLKAGGTGLNLTGADYVIHYDPWWNPAVEDQATDRAHRIGQTREVFNYKLIAKGTIEEKLLKLQERKRELVRDILVSETSGKQLTREDLDFLFEA